MDSTIAATLLPGLLDGAEGVRVCMTWNADDEPPREVEGQIVEVFTEGDETRVLWHSLDQSIGFDNRSPVFLRFLLSHWTARAHLCRVLAKLGHNVSRFLPKSDGLGGEVDSVEWSVALLSCSARRVARGLGPVVGVLGEWTERNPRLWWRMAIGRGFDNAHVGPTGWAAGVADAHGRLSTGPETGPAGMAAADRAALLAGFALANADGTLTTPEPQEHP